MIQIRFVLITIVVTVGLFLGMLAFLELGRRLGLRQIAKRGPDARTGVGVVDSAVYGLFGLLIGFSFSGAAGRYDQRRQLVAEAVNTAGTAWQRIDMLPMEPQVPVREAFRRYVDALVAWYGEAPGLSDATLHEPPTVTRAQHEVWSRSVEATLAPKGEQARMLLLPALNEMFGAVEKERMARRMHPPMLMWAMLLGTSLVAAIVAGYGLAGGTRRNWLYFIGIAASVSIATYVIIELEYPRLGLVRVNVIDQAFTELRTTLD